MAVQHDDLHPIPTPAVYQGNFFVSGGFLTKKFYCLKAATGNGKVVCIDTDERRYTGWSCSGANAAHSGLPQDGK